MVFFFFFLSFTCDTTVRVMFTVVLINEYRSFFIVPFRMNLEETVDSRN